jgi:hypothetical protein
MPSSMIKDARVARTSEEAVRGATGRDYGEWFALLDAWDAGSRAHGEIAAWLIGEHRIDNWWAQTITVEYERARVLRPPGGGREACSRSARARRWPCPSSGCSRPSWTRGFASAGCPGSCCASARRSRGARRASTGRTARMTALKALLQGEVHV